MVQCVFFGDIFCLCANNDAQFNFPVGVGATAWHHDIIVGADHSRVCFEEQNWVLRDICASFCRVIRIVQTDTQEFADIANARTDAGIA